MHTNYKVPKQAIMKKKSTNPGFGWWSLLVVGWEVVVQIEELQVGLHFTVLTNSSH